MFQKYLILAAFILAGACGAKAANPEAAAAEDAEFAATPEVSIDAASEIDTFEADAVNSDALDAVANGEVAADSAADAADSPAPDALESAETTPDSAADTPDAAATCATATCGDGKCATNCEKHSTCPQDCPVTCGDQECSGGENPKDCAEDCCGSCGDGKCIAYACGEQDPNSKTTAQKTAASPAATANAPPAKHRPIARRTARSKPAAITNAKSVKHLRIARKIAELRAAIACAKKAKVMTIAPLTAAFAAMGFAVLAKMRLGWRWRVRRLVRRIVSFRSVILHLRASSVAMTMGVPTTVVRRWESVFI